MYFVQLHIAQSSLLPAEELAAMQSQVVADLDEANEFLHGPAFPSAEVAERIRNAISSYAESVWMAFGFAASTPSCVYGMKRNGRLFVAKHVTPLPSGLIRLVLAHVSPFSAMPSGWLMSLRRAAPHCPMTH